MVIVREKRILTKQIKAKSPRKSNLFSNELSALFFANAKLQRPAPRTVDFVAPDLHRA